MVGWHLIEKYNKYDLLWRFCSVCDTMMTQHATDPWQPKWRDTNTHTNAPKSYLTTCFSDAQRSSVCLRVILSSLILHVGALILTKTHICSAIGALTWVRCLVATRRSEFSNQGRIIFAFRYRGERGHTGDAFLSFFFFFKIFVLNLNVKKS